MRMRLVRTNLKDGEDIDMGTRKWLRNITLVVYSQKLNQPCEKHDDAK